MKIDKTFELENGKVKFEGTLEGNELDFVIQTGLLVLLRQGAISSTIVPEAELESGELH